MFQTRFLTHQIRHCGRPKQRPGSLSVPVFTLTLTLALCSHASAQNNAPIYEAPFATASGSFEWDLFSGSASSIHLPDISSEGGTAELSLTFTPDFDNGPPFPLVASTMNIYAAGSFPDFTASLTDVDDSGPFTTVVLQLAAVGDAFRDFQLDGIAPTEFLNRGTVNGLGHGNGDAEFDTTFYWVEWQLDGDNRDAFDLTFSTIPHVSLAGLRIDYITSNSVVDLLPPIVLNLRGDFNRDGVVDVQDLDQYIGQIGMETDDQQSALDLNVDGIIGLNDFEEHFSQLVQIPGLGQGTFQGDLNLDGKVDVLGDAFQLVGNLGDSVSSWADGDLNADGQVDVLNDAFALVGNLGQNKSTITSTTAVPEQ